MLEIRNLTLAHRYDDVTLFEDVTLSVTAQTKCALIGEEGNGKSSFLKAIYQDPHLEDYSVLTGEIAAGNSRMAYLPQQLDEKTLAQAVDDFVEEIVVLDYRHYIELLEALALDRDFLSAKRSLRECSGGERIKLQLLRICMEEPDVLLLDEPSNDLDLDTLSWLETFLKSYPAAILFVSHDEDFIQAVANQILHFERIEKRQKPRVNHFKGSYEDYKSSRNNQFTAQNQIASNERRDARKQKERYQRLYQKVSHDLQNVSRQDPHSGYLLKKKMKSVKAMGRRFEREQENMTEFIEHEQAIDMFFDDNIKLHSSRVVLNFSLDELKYEDRVLSRNLQLQCVGPEKIGIIGRNGIGKSSLLKKISEELSLSNLKVAVMPQDYLHHFKDDANAIQYLQNDFTKDELTSIRTFLGSAKFTQEEMERSFKALSGGQKAKTLILKMIFEGAEVLVLDEPTRNLSPLSLPVIREIFSAYQGAIIAVSHDRRFLSEVCTRVLELKETGLEEVDISKFKAS